MQIRFLALAGSLVLMTLAGSSDARLARADPVQPVPPALHPYHHLHHALWELRDAHKEVKEDTTFDFGEHKEKALHAIHKAAQQIELILLWTGKTTAGAPTRGDLKEQYRGYKHHPHLHHALHELRHAHVQLREAKHDWGGHREAALHDVHHAIVQIELLLKHGRKLPG